MRLCLALLLCACAPVKVGCDLRDGALHGPEPRCQDRTGVQSAAFERACALTGGQVADEGCPTDEAVAGCDFGVDADGGEIVDWYYAPVRHEDVVATCADRGLALVVPEEAER